jgi:hypothetical protein
MALTRVKPGISHPIAWTASSPGLTRSPTVPDSHGRLGCRCSIGQGQSDVCGHPDSGVSPPHSRFGIDCRYHYQAKKEEMSVLTTVVIVFVAILLAEHWHLL